MRKLLSIAFYFVLLNASAQSLFFQNPVPVPNTQGYLWPRIVYTNNHPFITWGSAFPFNLYGSSLIGGSFTTPIQLNPVGYEPYIQSWTGPEMDAISDTVFVVFTDVNTQTAHVYAVRSIDGGLSFSDTIRVDFLSTDVPRFPNVTLRPGGNP